MHNYISLLFLIIILCLTSCNESPESLLNLTINKIITELKQNDENISKKKQYFIKPELITRGQNDQKIYTGIPYNISTKGLKLKGIFIENKEGLRVFDYVKNRFLTTDSFCSELKGFWSGEAKRKGAGTTQISGLININQNHQCIAKFLHKDTTANAYQEFEITRQNNNFIFKNILTVGSSWRPDRMRATLSNNTMIGKLSDGVLHVYDNSYSSLKDSNLQ